MIAVLRTTILLAAMACSGWCKPCHAQAGDADSRNAREIALADHVILESLAILTNPANRQPDRDDAWTRASAAEVQADLGLTILGNKFNRQADSALVNLVRFHFDGGFSEDFHCYIAQRGKKIAPLLGNLDAVALAQRCGREAGKLMASSPALFDAERSEPLCADPVRIKAQVRELLAMVKLGARCAEADF